ncbi:MAG: Lrp/AsnC family transcriptional regulator [Clostridiales bacterium]|nr:Lrp/AsnC family transcriptional regulator [Clostridiales bacterium]
MNQLLQLLDTNARLTNAQLAAMLGRTEAEVQSQLSELEHSGVVRGYKAVINWEKTDREYVTALIELRVTPKRDSGFESIAEQVMQFDEVESVYLMSGGYDLAVTVCGRTFRDVALFVARRLSTLDSVISTATHFVLRRYKDNGTMLLGGEADMRGAQ